jgi:crossover junction endodeoxyribonuclease RuvC
MGYYIGIDPSLTATGIIILDEAGNIEAQKLTSNNPKLPTISRVRQILDEIKEAISNNTNITSIGIEGFSFGSKGKSLFEIAYLGYRIREELQNFNLIDIAPTELKKYATGKGNSPKDIVMLNVYKRWGMEFHNNNLADAYVLAKICQEMYNTSTTLAEFQKEILLKLRKVEK